MENKKDYLKKYLNEEPKKKKKKIKVKIPVVSNPRIKIIDDDINVKSLACDSEEEEIGEEAPQIVEIIDETRKPRWKILGDDTENVPRKRLDSDSDQSPPRTIVTSENLTKKSRLDTDSDQSPPRPHQNNVKTKYSDDDLSPVRSNRKKHESDSDQSLPRSHSNKKHSEKSWKKQSDRSGSDISRSSRKKHKKKHKKHSKRNLSPQPTKRNRKIGSDSDQSPLRYSSSQERYKNKKNKHLRRHDTDSDESCENISKKHKDYNNLRKSEHGKEINRSQRIDDEKTDKKLKSDRKKSKEIEVDFEIIKEENDENEEKEILENNLEENKIEVELSTPFARYKDDPELEDHYKNQEREGDPMLAYIRKRKSKNKDESSENVKVYKGPPAPPNRFNINPGYRWDGVDRSNGFEKRHFDNLAQKKAFEELAYKWSVEDM